MNQLTIILTEQEWSLVAQLLDEHPRRLVNNIINQMNNQIYFQKNKELEQLNKEENVR